MFKFFSFFHMFNSRHNLLNVVAIFSVASGLWLWIQLYNYLPRQEISYDSSFINNTSFNGGCQEGPGFGPEMPPINSNHPNKYHALFQRDLDNYVPFYAAHNATLLFADILLVVQFNSNNFNKFAGSKVMADIYTTIFPEVVFTGSPAFNPSDPGSFGHGNAHNVLLCPGAESGFMAYECLSAVMKRFPGRSGYFMVHFDALVNWQAVADLPRDFLWIMGNGVDANGQPPVCNFLPIDMDTFQHPLFQWGWMDSVNPLTGRNVGAPAIFEFIRNAPDDLQEAYHRVCGTEPVCSATHITPRNQMGDVLYVPARYVERFRLLSRIAFNANLFLEFGAPMIFCGLAPSGDLDLLMLAGIPHNDRAFEVDRDYVYHQNNMASPDGLLLLREHVTLAAQGLRRRLPLYIQNVQRPKNESTTVTLSI